MLLIIVAYVVIFIKLFFHVEYNFFNIPGIFFYSFTVPTAKILGSPDIHVDKGSTINLTCSVKYSPEPPAYIFWYHHDEVCDHVTYIHLFKNFTSFYCNKKIKNLNFYYMTVILYFKFTSTILLYFYKCYVLRIWFKNEKKTVFFHCCVK